MTIEREILDPKLAEALDEIEAVLRRRQLAGNVVLASSTHAAFRFVLPEWSGVQFETPERLRVRMKAGEREHGSSTMHLVLSLRDLVTHQAAMLIHLAETVLAKLAEHGVEVDHAPFGGPEPRGDT
jgi:hypothetical protein